MSHQIKITRNVLKLTRKRSTILLICFAVFLCYLLSTIFRMQVSGHEAYRQKVIDQITTSSTVKAKRGIIYDSGMHILATTKTVWRIFLSPVDIAEASEDKGTDYSSLIAQGLSSILSLPYDTIYQKAKQSKTIDVTLKKSVEEDIYRKVTAFVLEHHLENMVRTEAHHTRYYPEGDFASAVIGFTGADNQGLFGLEYTYDKVLSGKDGYYVYAKDAKGNEMPDGYISYIEAQDGYSIVTTIDSYMQKHLEYTLKEIEETFDVQNRVAGIVMNVKTGGILAMANTQSFDLNDPYTLSPLYEKKLLECGYPQDSAEYKAYKNEMLYTMWQNKAVSDAYEPGSTFKIITVSAGIETGAVTLQNHYHCTGSFPIGGYNISCHKRGGHGHLTLSQALQQSCNPAMIQISASTGTKAFYRFVSDFGYLEKTGVDLPGEGKSIFHKENAIGSTELATASFGQRFKVTPLQQITAIAAVANGGYLLRPYVVEKIIGENGEVIFTHQTEVRRQVISNATSMTVSQMLEEGVSGDGGAKNAAVLGYKIAAKTGTSEKFDILDENGNSYLRIGSCVAFAPSDSAEIAILIIVDEPTTAKYGSMVAAPYISDLMEVYLPYLNFENALEQEQQDVIVEQFCGMSIKDAKKAIQNLGLKVEIIGEGDTVIRQSPICGTTIQKDIGKIILYTAQAEEDTVTLPSLLGKSPSEVNQLLLNLGLNIYAEGVQNCQIGIGAVATQQSIPPQTKVGKGTVVRVTFLYTDSQD